jgi:hypothetical protein
MPIDNRVAVAALRAIEKKGGRLTPDEVVAAARSPKHPLHSYFEWDDKVAGPLYRREQARELLAEVRYEVTNLNLSAAIQYVRDPSADSHTQGYVSTVNLANDEEQARAAVISELERVLACLRRARDVASAVNVELDVLDLMRRTESLSMTLRKLRAAS